MSRGRRVWEVRAGGPRTLGDVLAAMGVEPAALAAGRVWVGRRRAEDAALELPVGARVEVHPARAPGERATLVERAEGFVVAFKPAALPTEADRSGHASLVEEIAELVGAPLHAVSRLDVGVSGLVLLSEGRAAHRRAAALGAAGALRRRYLAVAERAPKSERGTLSQPVDGRPASTEYALVARAREHSLPDGTRAAPVLLRLDPVTGRKHQLRLHARALGAPLLGDRAHGGASRLTAEGGRVLRVPRVMLHAGRLELPRQAGGVWVIRALPPADFVELWCALGGGEAELEQNLA